MAAHGADSHEWDQLGYQCTTAEWLQASDMVYQMLRRCRDKVPVAVTLALFGGYPIGYFFPGPTVGIVQVWY